MSWFLAASKRIALRYIEAQEKIKVKRKDSGKTVWVSPNTLKNNPDQYDSYKEETTEDKQLEGEAIISQIKRPEGWRSWDDEPELKPSNIKEWFDDHQVTTTEGSVLLGTAHVSDDDDDEAPSKTVLHKHIIPNAKRVAEKAIKNGKKVVFLGEGQSFEGDDLTTNETYNEQHAVAKALNKKFGDKVKQDTWDDESVNIFEPYAEVWGSLTDAAGGSRVKAEAAMAVFLGGQGDGPEALSQILSPESKVLIKKRFGVDITKELSEKDVDKLYRVAFPGDFGDPPNEVSAIGEAYNAARQDNLVKKIKKIENEGGVAIVTPGSSHAWSLKPVLEKRKAEASARDWMRKG